MKRLNCIRGVYEVLDSVKALVYLSNVGKWTADPLFEKPFAHAGFAPVEKVEQRTFRRGLLKSFDFDQLKRLNGLTVEKQGLVAVEAGIK